MPMSIPEPNCPRCRARGVSTTRPELNEALLCGLLGWRGNGCSCFSDLRSGRFVKHAWVRGVLVERGRDGIHAAECLMSAIQRMIDEMQRRGYAKKTIAEYSGSVRRLATYFGKCPSKLTLEQIRAYQLHLAETGRHFCELLQRDGHGPAVPVPPDAGAGLVDRPPALRSAGASLADRTQPPGGIRPVASAFYSSPPIRQAIGSTHRPHSPGQAPKQST